MYDMYPWDKPADPGRLTPANPEPAIQAVQVALDRRDNGGDAASRDRSAHGRPDPPVRFWHGFTND